MARRRSRRHQPAGLITHDKSRLGPEGPSRLFVWVTNCDCASAPYSESFRITTKAPTTRTRTPIPTTGSHSAASLVRSCFCR